MMSMAAEVRKKLTWEDIRDLPEGEKAELVEGELYLAPTAGTPHQSIGTRLTVLIFNFVEERDLGWFSGRDVHYVFDEHNHFEPDLSFVAKDRMHLIRGPYVDGPPDLAIEILSPSNRKHDTELKFRYYARFGVKEYWMVDPDAKAIAIFALEGADYELVGEFTPGQPIRSRVLEGLSFDPAKIF
ncbi:MAG: hypothetical protein GC160_04200 [Acidobacteria bacterium]|nr:hypothetical protein [Acidobacteriota bacterium]